MTGLIGWGEALIVLGVVVLLFGASRLPRLARSIGGLRRELEDGFEDD